MDAYTVMKKVQEAIKAIEEYEREHRNEKSIWDSDINEGLNQLSTKRHILGSSGTSCPTCNGSGSV